jgi:hypothetical protein
LVKLTESVDGRHAPFDHGSDVLAGGDVVVPSLLVELLETKENTPEDFFLRRPLGFLPSSSVGDVYGMSCWGNFPKLVRPGVVFEQGRVQADLVCMSPRLRGVLSVSGDVSKASAR